MEERANVLSRNVKHMATAAYLHVDGIDVNLSESIEQVAEGEIKRAVA